MNNERRSMKTWRERIAAARERGAFTEEEKRLASSWCSCAVGEQHAKAPEIVRYYEADPSDPILRIGAPAEEEPLLDIGSDFYAAVMTDTFSDAEILLDAIEDRVLQLKREA